MTEIKLYKSPWRAVRVLVISSLFILVGVWGVRDGGIPLWTAWLSIGFFGLGLPIGFFHLFDRRPKLVFDEIGIHDRTVHQNVINWEIIQDAYLLTISRQKFICLVIDETYKPSNSKGGLYRQATKFNEVLGAQELNIPVGLLSVNPEALLAFILLMRTATPSSRTHFLHQTLDTGFARP